MRLGEIETKLTAEEVIEWILKHYDDGEYKNAFGMDCSYSVLRDKYAPEEIVRLIEQWKFSHEKKEPEIETVDICRIIEIQSDGYKRCVHEEDISLDAESSYGGGQAAVEEILKHYCMEHEGRFFAEHEVISRVKEAE